MELELLRTYGAKGTNGSLLANSVLVSHTIELPWLSNEHGKSCIPEGRYEIRPRFNEKFGNHFMVLNVPEREGILIHPANDAMKELRGCIAPVTELTGEGSGVESRRAVNALTGLLQGRFEKENVFITIKS